MKTIFEGNIVSSKTGSLGVNTPIIQVVPTRYVRPGPDRESASTEETEIMIFLKTSNQQLNISISLEEWDNFVGKVREEIEQINNHLVVQK